MTDIFFTRTRPSGAGFAPVFRRVRIAGSLLARGYSRYRQRQALSELDDRLLADLGLSRNDVARECGKSWLPL